MLKKAKGRREEQNFAIISGEIALWSVVKVLVNLFICSEKNL